MRIEQLRRRWRVRTSCGTSVAVALLALRGAGWKRIGEVERWHTLVYGRRTRWIDNSRTLGRIKQNLPKHTMAKSCSSTMSRLSASMARTQKHTPPQSRDTTSARSLFDGVCASMRSSRRCYIHGSGYRRGMPTLSRPLGRNGTNCFTLQYESRARELTTPVGVSEPLGPGLGDSSSVRLETFTGVWDTGATCSVISRDVVEALMLGPIDRVVAETAGGTYEACGYLVAVHLPNGVVVPAIRVLDSPSIGGADALIGMDIIGHGDLAITNLGGRTCMSFQMPSGRRIDFAEDSSDLDR